MILLALPAAAQSPSPAQARQWCFGASKLGDEQRLAGCSAVLRANPSNALALANRGEIFRRKGETERALATSLKLGNLDAAIADYDMALSAKPKLDSALYGRGLAKRKKGDAEGAARDIAAAKAINAGIADSFAHYGVE
ncbi:hypothetical protein RAD16_03870 [Bradyrhizobium sp. 18BD]